MLQHNANVAFKMISSCKFAEGLLESQTRSSHLPQGLFVGQLMSTGEGEAYGFIKVVNVSLCLIPLQPDVVPFVFYLYA